MNLAVCIPIKDALPHFKKMMSSLFENTDREFSLFLCDDFSGKPTADYIRTLPAKVIIRHKKQQFFTRSANDLLIISHLAGADYTFLLNSDLVLKKGWVGKMLSHFEDPSVYLVGSLYSPKKKSPEIIYNPEYATGHAWVLRNKYLPKIGILDERHFHIKSDQYYSYRINTTKYKVLLDRHAPILHHGGASWGHDLSRLNRINPICLSKKRPVDFFNHPELVKQYKEKFNL